jgi:hypothetical protein
MGGFPALMIKAPESPLQQYSQAQQVVGQQQQIQSQQLENQVRTRQLQDQDALTRTMASWDGKDVGSLPMLVVKNGGSGQAAMSMTQSVLGVKEKAANIAKDDALTGQARADTLAKTNDALRGRILNVVGIQDPAAKQAAWESEVSKEEQAGTVQPGSVSHTYPGDAQATALANQHALGSQLVKEAQEKQKMALDAWKPVGGQLVNAVTGEKIGGLQNADSLNSALTTRWQVLHPGESLPDYYKMGATSTPTDFDRVDKLLEATEKGAATKAQQETINAMRQQTFELNRDKADMNPVVGTTKDGRSVLVPMSQAQQMGVQNPMKADADMVNKALAARHWLNLANKQGDAKGDPADMGIMQLVDKLDAEDKLGPIASRWNEFMTGKVGAGDPEVAALRAKMGLSSTLLMQAHVGSRGSSQMLEHFEDLANQKKLDGPTLKAALGAEVNYVTDKAMDPSPPSYTRPTPPTKQGTAPTKKVDNDPLGIR